MVSGLPFRPLCHKDYNRCALVRLTAPGNKVTEELRNKLLHVCHLIKELYEKADLSTAGCGLRQIDISQDYSGCLFVRYSSHLETMNVLVNRMFGEGFNCAQSQYKSNTTCVQAVKDHHAFVKNGRSLPEERWKGYNKSGYTMGFGGSSVDCSNQLTKWTSQKEVDLQQKTFDCYPKVMTRIEGSFYTYTWLEIVKLLTKIGWLAAQTKVKLVAHRINGGDEEEADRPDNQRLLRHLTTDTEIPELWNSWSACSNGTIIIVTEKKIAILFSENTNTRKIYGVKSQTYKQLPAEEAPLLTELQLKKLAIQFGLPDGKVNTVLDLRGAQKLLKE